MRIRSTAPYEYTVVEAGVTVRPGETYELDDRVAQHLIVAGLAEPVEEPPQASPSGKRRRTSEGE